MYGNRYNSTIRNTSASTVFSRVASIGTANGYFNSSTGTSRSTAGSYVRAAFNAYGVSTSVYGLYSANYSNIKSSLLSNRLIYLGISNHGYYGAAHAVACYAYTRLVSTTTGYYKTYVKVADGFSSSGRYIDLSSLTDGQYYSIAF